MVDVLVIFTVYTLYAYHISAPCFSSFYDRAGRINEDAVADLLQGNQQVRQLVINFSDLLLSLRGKFYSVSRWDRISLDGTGSDAIHKR